MEAVMFDLDETILDRTASLKDFLHWQAQGMLQSDVADKNLFIERFIELDAYGTVWKDKVYENLVNGFFITQWSVSELLKSYELCFSGFCKPKPGVVQAIKTLKNRGKKIALVSNGKSPFKKEILDP